MDGFVETMFESYWKANEDGEYMSIADCGDHYECSVAQCAPNWSIVLDCNCFHVECKEFSYHEKGAVLEIGDEITSLNLSQMEIKDLKIYMIDC